MKSSQLRQIADLLERRENLLEELAGVENQLRASGWKEDGQPGAPSQGRGGYLKNTIIPLIQSAGDSGITIDQLAQALQRSSQRINIWYHMTGRKIPNIQRVGSKLHWREQ